MMARAAELLTTNRSSGPERLVITIGVCENEPTLVGT